MTSDIWTVVHDGVSNSRVNELLQWLISEIDSFGSSEFAAVAKTEISNDVLVASDSLNRFVGACYKSSMSRRYT